MKKISAFLSDLFFVPRCEVCGREPDGKEDGILCRTCRNRYELEEKSVCHICRNTFDKCVCRPQFSSPFVENYRRVTLYREDRVSGKLILAAKDRSSRHLTVFLAKQIAAVCKNGNISPDVITYIPCSDRNYRKKGFDHGKDLAFEVANMLSVPVVCCFKRYKGREQKHLNAQERLENSKVSLEPILRTEEKVKGRRVLVVDDIMTTGASSLVASIYLHEMGAESIDFVSFGSR